ncbi:hypothetical protein E5676_scaffold828G00450 [Cucumis melo var. makuwa]|uniref:Reverse transcriptase n=1 Tax=Cucumis melo var. makuwa TaxID=1194695 RepID=A0A5D3CIL8_CUCMM|nr:hypothetical protein E6C27_scaffold508G00500 [Cucumis melo var. makuwa]TYK11671.1 hypothetical protein E5676_scaffold828G00450 [Cucumis melo var. makuwa]
MVYWWDFNTTRWAHERFPIGRATRGMRKFNNFIDKANLLEVPLSNGWFTWSCHGSLFARSLIDRFFISKDWDDAFENSRVNRQSPIFSDHFPLILEAGSISWGPSPFRFSNSWFLDKACVAVIKTSWRQSAVAGRIKKEEKMSCFMKLKGGICWQKGGSSQTETEFLLKVWGTMKPNILALFNDFYENGRFNACVQENFVCLIQKKEVMPSVIAETQSAFKGGRQILDPILVANEVVEEYQVIKKKGWILKLDLEKAFDRVD